MAKKIAKVIKKICTAVFIIYGFNIILSSVNIFIPINIISIVIDAEQDTINTLSGKIGKLQGVTSKVVYSKA